MCISNELTATHPRPSAQHVPYIPTAHQPLPGLTLPKGLATDVVIKLVSDCVAEVAIVWLCCAVRVWSGPPSERSTSATRVINLGTTPTSLFDH